MKTICIGKELFGDVVNDTDPRFNSKRSDKDLIGNAKLEASVPDSLDQKCLERYLFHFKFTHRS